MNIYETVTSRILEQLEAGVVPWRKTWTVGLPRSLATDREYRGINLFLLSASDYGSPYWLTYREAARQGGHVRKGERATPVIYWKWRTPEEMERLATEKKVLNPAPCVPFTSAVFNLEQVEGIQAPEPAVQKAPENRLATAESVLEGMRDAPEILHGTSKDPSYLHSLDRVSMPHLSQFESAEEYFATLYHELIHATGHTKRLNRFAETGGDAMAQYSFEELVAEMGSSFLCAFANLKNSSTEQLQASYIAEWMKVFRKDGQILVKAASAAQKAVDFIRAITFEKSAAKAA